MGVRWEAGQNRERQAETPRASGRHCVAKNKRRKLANGGNPLQSWNQTGRLITDTHCQGGGSATKTRIKINFTPHPPRCQTHRNKSSKLKNGEEETRRVEKKVEGSEE